MQLTRFHRSRLVRLAPVALVATVALLAACSGDGGGDDGGAATTSSTTVPEGTVLGAADGTYRATIRRTEGGVPHVTADDLGSLSFGQGWASAEDRACDLADQVLKVTGRRARWFGPGEDDANVESDLAWRSIDIATVAAEDWSSAPDRVTDLFTAYTAGWNAHLEEVGVDALPGWCAGAEWVRPLEPVEVYTYARSIPLQASSGAVAGLIATAQPPAGTPLSGPATPTTVAARATHTVPAPTAGDRADPAVASNGWAIGAERTEAGGGMLLANPHFPWEGELRFWEVHLTVPGRVDIYGAQLSGLPGIGIGFTDDLAWTHTVSDGNRFTAYTLDLVPGSPTTYRYGDREEPMTSTEVAVEVLGPDGSVTPRTRTMYRSRYGPILDFPGVGWTDTSTITFRDANIGNDEFVEQYLAMMQAQDLDDLIEAHRRYAAVPLFNTIAVSADGRAWYADTSATPNLSEASERAYRKALEDDPLVKLAGDNGAVLLDGSDPMNEWEEVDGARDPGLVPFEEMPVVERDDYLFNANDSFWMPHATEVLEGDYSILHGPQRTARSPRTRQNATVLSDTSDRGPSGEDGRFSLRELTDLALDNEGFTAARLREEVVRRCTGAGPVAVPAIPAEDDAPGLPAGTVDLTAACAVLDGWDGIYDLDRSGPPLWRELMARYEYEDLTESRVLWAEPFDPEDPVATPRGLAPAPDGGADPVLVNLARAVQVLEGAGLPLDVTLGRVQVADRNGTLVPVHGGNGDDGTTNIVSWGRSWTILDPALAGLERRPVAVDATLATVSRDGDGTKPAPGYRINAGTSFLLAVEFAEDGPRARALLTYGDTADREDPDYVEATRRFSDKRWRTVAFTPAQVAEATTETITVRG